MVKQHLSAVALIALLMVSGCVPNEGCEGGRCGPAGPSDSLWIEDEGALVETPTPVAGWLPSYIRPLIRVDESGNRIICSAVVISRNTALVSRQCEIGIFYTGGNNQDRQGPFFQGEYFLGSANDSDGTIRPTARLLEVRGRDYGDSLPVQFLIFDRTIARTSAERATLSSLNLRGPLEMSLVGYEVGTAVSRFSIVQSVSPARTPGFFVTAIPPVVGFDKTVLVFHRGALVAAVANGLSAGQSGGELLNLSALGAYRNRIDAEVESSGARPDNANPLPAEINLYTGRG